MNFKYQSVQQISKAILTSVGAFSRSGRTSNKLSSVEKALVFENSTCEPQFTLPTLSATHFNNNEERISTDDRISENTEHNYQ